MSCWVKPDGDSLQVVSDARDNLLLNHYLPEVSTENRN